MTFQFSQSTDQRLNIYREKQNSRVHSLSRASIPANDWQLRINNGWFYRRNTQTQTWRKATETFGNSSFAPTERESKNVCFSFWTFKMQIHAYSLSRSVSCDLSEWGTRNSCSYWLSNFGSSTKFQVKAIDHFPFLFWGIPFVSGLSRDGNC